MIGLKQDNHDDDQWRATISRKIRRIEILFVLAVILGISFVSVEIWKIRHDIDIVSASNLHQMEYVMSSLRDVQDMILLKTKLKVVEPIDGKVEPSDKLRLTDRQSRKLPTTAFDSDKKKTSLPENDILFSRRGKTSIFDGKSHRCDELQLLAPHNPFNNFIYDERVDQILNVLHALSSAEKLLEFNSPQHKAACWILYADILHMPSPNEFLVERYILAVLLYTMDQSEVLMQSLTTCEYDFVDCDKNGFVTKVNMTALSKDRSTNPRIIPAELSYFQHLEYLYMTSCSLEGSIPFELGALKTLKELKLEKNNITGSLPSEMEILSSLEVLSLMSNLITGTIPSKMRQMSGLKILNLGSNSISGTIPSGLFFSKKLLDLRLDNNKFHGTIDPNVHQLESLETIYLNNNQLHGPIPSEIGELSSLKKLFFGNSGLSGTFPTEIGNLHNIEWLVLDNNYLTGTVPDVFGNLTRLDAFNIEHNQLSGSFPESLWNVTFGFGLILQSNLITGTAPEDICSGKFNLKLDYSSWFLDEPRVKCTCCDDSACNLWNSNEPTVGGSRRPTCPTSNIQTVEYMNALKMTDNIAEVSFEEISESDRTQTMELCLSPTGCYSFFDDFNSDQNIGVNFQYNIQYSASSMALGKDNECEAVEICGSSFAKDHPRRKGLNHLTQIVAFDFSSLDSSSPKLKALCWIMNNDTLFDRYNECDGTMLQRYILAYFYISQGKTFEFNNFSSNATCKWPGVTCDEKNEKFIEKLILPNRNLNGFLITEIGLLKRLIEIDLHSNSLSGTIDPVIFLQLPFMEYFQVGDNNFQGTIPNESFMVPNLKEANMSSNSLIGSLPADIDKSKHLKLLDVRDNLLRGSIPHNLYKCEELEWIDLSRNGFSSTISSEIGNLRELKVIKVNENILSGSIPSTMFKATALQTLMLQSNKLTGSIPTEIGTVDFIESVHLSYNAIKGNIPTQMSKLRNLKSVLLNKNFLTGTAPEVILNQDDFEFITDCGNPSFLLQKPLKCESCTKCCNSLGLCQIKPKRDIHLNMTGYLVVILTPITITFVFYIIYLGMKKVNIQISDREVDLSRIYNQESTYCLIFSDDALAWAIYMVTVAIQTLLFNLFLSDLSFDSEIFMWEFLYNCPENSSECTKDGNRGTFGWILFYIVVLTYIAKDFVLALRQLSKSILLFDLRLGFSGVVLFFLTGLALVTSVIFNTALATTNPDLIMNAVILVFINDIDEQLFGLLQSLAPDWLGKRSEEIGKNMKERKNDNNDKLPELQGSINIEEEDLEILVEERVHALEVNERYQSGLRMLGLSIE